MMLYAKVVLGIPVEGPFDYIVPAEFAKKVKTGSRVWVSFGNRKMPGYIVKLSGKTEVRNLKVLSDVPDNQAVLDKNMLLLTRQLSEYYCCSWGEAIETALPEALRKGRRIPDIAERLARVNSARASAEVTLIHDLGGQARWEAYFPAIKETLESGSSVIVLLSDMHSALKAQEIIAGRLGIQPFMLYRKKPRELQDWLTLKDGKANIVVGTRSAIFAPLDDLGLVIMDEEQDSAYKQDQVPHYHAREIAFMRVSIEKARLILASASPSLEALHLAKKKKIKYILHPPVSFPEVKVIGTYDGSSRFSQKNIISKHLQDIIASALDSRNKILLFLNRKGFATFASCRNCGHVIRCPRCDVNLVYHFQENVLSCFYCNFKMPPANICPKCNSGYIRYSGIGTEKIESELSRLFPQAKINRLDEPAKISPGAADIFISTKSIIKEAGDAFDLVVALAVDNSLNRIDFRAGEKTFAVLIGLLGLARRALVIQSGLFEHPCLTALLKKDIEIFYNEEFRQRKELRLPPFSHLCLVKLRGRNEERVKEISNALFGELSKYNKNKALKIIAVKPAYHHKLRGKFCWQILVKADSALKITKFLKKRLKEFSHSGIIVTVDIDPL